MIQNLIGDSKLGPFIHFLKGLFQVYENFKENNKTCYSYRLCINYIIIGKENYKSFKLQCIDASIAFENIKKRGKFNFILASGTLSPYDIWERDLGIDFQIRLDNKHVIDEKN